MKMISGSKHRFYSLIELLVVIAIIAILAAILMPVLRSTRETARRATCINNQKNFGNYIHQFAMENRGDLDGLLGDWKKWLGNMAKTAGSDYDFSKDEYARFEENKIDAKAREILKIARCPADVTQGKQSYGLNDPYGRGTMHNPNDRVCKSRLQDIDAPSDLIILGERWSNFKTLATNTDWQYEICAPFHLRSNRTSSDAVGEDWNAIHKGNIPLLYLDGHVKHGNIVETLRGRDLKNMYSFSDRSTGGSWSDDRDRKK